MTFADQYIEMAHGAGGKASRRLIEGLVAPLLMPKLESPLVDASVIEFDTASAEGSLGAQSRSDLVMTTDGFVVQPRQFPGGSIGSLAVHGTVNDLAVSGADPQALVCALILEAGLEVSELRQEIEAMAVAAANAGVAIIGGDTKVVEKGKADGIYITTTGVGRMHPKANLGAGRIEPADQVIVSGPIGDHGITVLLARGDLELRADLESDSRAINGLTRSLLDALGNDVHWMRDPTRGGVATALNELALDCGVCVSIDESKIPVRDAVRGACEILGLDPLHIANEGQFLAVVAESSLATALDVLRGVPGGAAATHIGSIRAAPAGTVLCGSAFGGERIVGMLVGDPLPRIC